MAVTVIGNDVWDVRRQVGPNEPRYDISIRWRSTDNGRKGLPGCIVDATRIQGVIETLTPREFSNAREALVFLREILERVDELSKQET